MAGAPPIFDVGEILDLRYDDNLPDRIRIDMVYKKVHSDGWMYYVLSEQANGRVYMSERRMFHSHTDHGSKAYENKMVQQLLAMGYRFVCNTSRAKPDVLDNLCGKKEISEVIMAKAVYPNGVECDNNNDHGIWIKYNTVITIDDYNGSIQFTRIK